MKKNNCALWVLILFCAGCAAAAAPIVETYQAISLGKDLAEAVPAFRETIQFGCRQAGHGVTHQWLDLCLHTRRQGEAQQARGDQELRSHQVVSCCGRRLCLAVDVMVLALAARS